MLEAGAIMHHMHPTPSKHRRRLRLAFVYTLMAVTIISGVTILVLVIQGYRFNQYDGKVEQGGLVQFDSDPSGATVTLDDTELANRTASKLTVSAGTHTVTMSRDDYLAWTKSVTVKAGGVLWLDYARLYPINPEITTAASFDTVSSALIAPSRKQTAIIAKASEAALYLMPLNDESATLKRVAIDSTKITQASSGDKVSYSLVGWDQDSQYCIVKHVYGSKTEYLSVNTSDGSMTNITTALGVTATKVEYVLGSHTAVYLLTSSHEVRRGDLSASTMSGPLLSDIKDFAQADRSTVTYETLMADDDTRSVGYLTSGASKPRKVRTVKDDGKASFKLRIGTYYGDSYLLVAYGDTTTIYTADIPASDSSTALSWQRVGWLTTPGGVKYLGFSSDEQRFVYAQMSDAAATYDLETDAVTRATFQGTMKRSLDWVDDYHIGATADGDCYYYDFDGTNGRAVATGVLDKPVTISENGSYFYYFTTENNKAVLKRVQLAN